MDSDLDDILQTIDLHALHGPNLSLKQITANGQTVTVNRYSITAILR